MHKIKKIEVNTPAYLNVLQLRDLVLRKPLGRNLFDEDLSGEKEEIIYAIVDQDEQVLASVQFKPLNDNRVKLRQMAVDPHYHKKGIGRKLVTYAENQLKKTGYKQIEMHARKTAVGFYSKLGYKITGNEFTEVGIPHVRMFKNL
jgi:predicted GNAT family N-acyltransferase